MLMERRLATILAADVVGYSRLMEADEEAAGAFTRGTFERRWPPGRRHAEQSPQRIH